MADDRRTFAHHPQQRRDRSGLLGLRRYCQSHRSRLAAAASAPKTRRYSASTPRWSSGLYRSISGMSGAERLVTGRRLLNCIARSALSIGLRRAKAASAAVLDRAGGARLGCGVPIGAFHGLVGSVQRQEPSAPVAALAQDASAEPWSARIQG